MLRSKTYDRIKRWTKRHPLTAFFNGHELVMLAHADFRALTRKEAVEFFNRARQHKANTIRQSSTWR